jgi:hypothetical protein
MHPGLIGGNVIVRCIYWSALTRQDKRASETDMMSSQNSGARSSNIHKES